MIGTIVFIVSCLSAALWAHLQMRKVPASSNPKDFQKNLTNYGLLDILRFVALLLAVAAVLMKVLDHFHAFER